MIPGQEPVGIFVPGSPVKAHARKQSRVELVPVLEGEGLQERPVGHGRRVSDLAPVVLHAHRASLGECLCELVALLGRARLAQGATRIQYAPEVLQETIVNRTELC